MSDDLISREKAIDAINELHDKPNAWLDLAVDSLENLPTIDAVQVVRCKDCKYYKENTLACSRYGLEDDDYCSWAERKEE